MSFAQSFARRSLIGATIALICVSLFTLTPNRANAILLTAQVSPDPTAFGNGDCTTVNGHDSGAQTTLALADVSCTFGRHAVAEATPGHVGALADGGTAFGTSAVATYFDNFFFTPLDPNDTTQSINISLNLNLNGHLHRPDTFDFAVFIGNPSTSAARFSLAQSSTGADSCTTRGFTVDLCPPAGLPDVFYATQVTTTDVSVFLNQPVAIGIQLTVSALPKGSADFLNSIDFPDVTNLFNVPDGFTVNAPDSFVVNNRFLPPTKEVEPTTLATLGFGLVAMSRLRRRRKAPRKT